MTEVFTEKLVIRGGSIAAGHGVKQGYAEILMDMLKPRGINVINVSRFQDNSFDGVWSFPTDIEPHCPENLLIHFGIDDTFFPVYRSEFKENLVLMVRRARRLFSSRIFLATSHTFDDPYDMESVNIFYRVIREVSLDLQCTMIPVHTYWAGYLQDKGLTNKDLVLTDTRYPNEIGHRVYADVIMNHLDSMNSLPG